MDEQDGLRASVTFIGNATTVLRLGAFTLLTDPNFVPAGNRVHLGYGMWTRRLKDPARSIAQLPPYDAVLLSHFHGDHRDRVATAEVPRSTPVITTPQAQRTLRRRRFEEVQGLPTWETHDWSHGRQRLSVTAVPGRHGDAMIIHLGGTRILGMLLTMDDKQGVATTELIRPGLTIPVHNDDYTVMKSPLSAFLNRAREHGLTGIRPIARGDALELPLR